MPRLPARWSFLALFVLGVCYPFAGAQAELKVGLVLDKGGKDDKSFNAAAYQGALKAKGDLKVFVKTVEATDDNAFEPMLRSFAQRDFDLIIGIGFAQLEAMRKIAAQFPQKHFAVVDAEVSAPNVRSLLFEEHEGSFLVGVIAARTSKTGKIGFIGGMDIPLIRRFEKGYDAGAQAANPKIQISSNYVGVTADSWNNPAKAKELAISQYSSGVDVIFGAAGASTNGIFDAAEEASGGGPKKFAIGVDSNQNWVKPGFILTSMMKRVDEAVYQVIKDGSEGRFSAGVQRFGLANKGIDYALDQYNDKLIPASLRAEVDQYRAKIIAGKIVVPDYYKMKK